MHLDNAYARLQPEPFRLRIAVMAITPAKTRAARGLTGWTQDKLAAEAKVGLSTIRNFESGRSLPITNNLVAIQRALELAGVRFTERGVEMAADE